MLFCDDGEEDFGDWFQGCRIGDQGWAAEFEGGSEVAIDVGDCCPVVCVSGSASFLRFGIRTMAKYKGFHQKVIRFLINCTFSTSE